ncbi:hypothetical protein TcasGA2_TC031582 [Tribolium castaneum]|uniref:Uncharacterized protein n=1 Tax=Tribolium castaneum TaxID=7070 RepID=A0A139WPM5_TRICA|nr:hypothetical protein TcasGA2_TC031582 [Tribolium castaneum]
MWNDNVSDDFFGLVQLAEANATTLYNHVADQIVSSFSTELLGEVLGYWDNFETASTVVAWDYRDDQTILADVWRTYSGVSVFVPGGFCRDFSGLMVLEPPTLSLLFVDRILMMVPAYVVEDMEVIFVAFSTTPQPLGRRCYVRRWDFIVAWDLGLVEAWVEAWISTARFKELAQEVALTFPGGFAESYYIPYCKQGDKICSAKGILWDRYVAKRRNYRKIGLISKKEKNNVEATITSHSESASASADSELIEDYLQWLRNNIMPWSTVMDYWKNSTNARKNFHNIAEYFAEFPALRQPSSYTLLEENENTTAKNYIKKFNYQSFSEKQKEILGFLILPLIIPPCTVKSKKPGDKYRPSKIEIQQSFCCLIESIDKLQETIENRKNKLSRFNETFQPMLVSENIVYLKEEQIFYYLKIRKPNLYHLEKC